jgi:hypothetical protein
MRGARWSPCSSFTIEKSSMNRVFIAVILLGEDEEETGENISMPLYRRHRLFSQTNSNIMKMRWKNHA